MSSDLFIDLNRPLTPCDGSGTADAKNVSPSADTNAERSATAADPTPLVPYTRTATSSEPTESKLLRHTATPPPFPYVLFDRTNHPLNSHMLVQFQT